MLNMKVEVDNESVSFLITYLGKTQKSDQVGNLANKKHWLFLSKTCGEKKVSKSGFGY